MEQRDARAEKPKVIEPSEAQLDTVVDAFYESVRQDDLLGPIFNQRVDHWPLHLDKIKRFWSSIMLGTGRYKGNPFAAHAPLARTVDEIHFERWLLLWSQTCRRLCDLPVALELEGRAQRIAASLRAGLLFHAQMMDPDNRPSK